MKQFIFTEDAVVEIHLFVGGDASSRRYDDIIRAIRHNLAESYALDRPVAAAAPEKEEEEEDENKPGTSKKGKKKKEKKKKLKAPGFYDIILHVTHTEFVKVRFTRHNLYLIGFRANNSGPWHEMQGDGGGLLIPGSTPLPFGHNYNDMVGEMNGGPSTSQSGNRNTVPRVCNGGLTDVEVGFTALANAARWLVSLTVTRSETAQALIVMAVMFSEAARFEPILDFLRDTYRRNVMVQDWMVFLMQHCWEKLSKRVLTYEARPAGPWAPLPPLTLYGREGREEWGVREVTLRTIQDVARILGILLRATLD